MARSLKSVWVFLSGVLALFGLQVGTATAQNAVVMCSEIQGESQREGDVGCVDVLAWSWGASSSVSISPIGVIQPGNTSLQDLSFTKPLDSASEDFLRHLVTGMPIKGVVEFREYKDCGSACPAPEPYLTVKLRDVLVTSQSMGAGGGPASENVSLLFADVSFCYRATLKEGALGAAQCFAYSRTTGGPITPF